MPRDVPYTVKCTHPGTFLDGRLSLVVDYKMVLNSASSDHKASDSVSIRKRSKWDQLGKILGGPRNIPIGPKMGWGA